MIIAQKNLPISLKLSYNMRWDNKMECELGVNQRIHKM